MNSRGDTIIEVLLAITVFSLVAMGAITIMNQGTNAAQRALEITLVRQQIDAQAEALRAIQQAAAAGSSTEWKTKIAKGMSTSHYSSVAGSDANCPAPTDITDSFFMDARSAVHQTSANYRKVGESPNLPYANVDYNGASVNSYGIWIETDYDAGTSLSPDLYTFTVNACWYGAGIENPMKISTVVRLYDPTS